jgi:hypothetical protein
MLSDNQTTTLLFAVVVLAALIGGTTAGAVVATYTNRRQITVRPVSDGPLTVPVQLQADPVALRIMVSRPEPVTVEVQPVPAEDRADIAARIIQETQGQIGPRALARILNVAPSTAQAYVQKANLSSPQEENITQ